MQEYLKSVLPSAGTPAASGQDEPCSDWENLKRTLEEIQANMGGMEAEVGRVKAQIAEMAADMVAADDGVRDARRGGDNADGGAGREDRHPSPGMYFAR